MDKSQNLPSIDEDALDGVAGGASPVVDLVKLRMAIGSAIVTTPIKLAGARVAAIGAGLSAVGDAFSQVGDALLGAGKD